ncbi:prolipoprotein diacylglyceryl transferase [Arthrobacter crystallopoietes]|uniref:prolipoprotein diacylglyceryl transferase n=2 Tax=Micrococcaceae TaxID=1268 RepID=UPI003D1A454D
MSSALVIPASIPSPGWSGFTIGPVTVHAYALCILAGIVAALWLTNRRWQARGGPEGTVWDVAIWAIPFGIIGGRLYHVFSSPDAYFGPNGNLALIPQIWLGGLGIWGAVALGLVGAWIGCRRAGVKLTAFMDAAAPGVLLAQAIGRWGNWFNQELFGAPTDLPWGLEIDADNPNFPTGAEPGTLFHPTFLYESLWNLAGVALLLVLDRKFRFRRGMLFWLYVAYYTLGRVWIEMLRIDDAEMITLFGLTQRLNVWTSVLLLVAALVIFAVLARRPRTAEDETVYLPGHGPETDDGATLGAAEAGKASPAAEANGVAAKQTEVNEQETNAKKAGKNVSVRSHRGNLTGTSTEPEGSPASDASGTAGPAEGEGK